MAEEGLSGVAPHEGDDGTSRAPLAGGGTSSAAPRGARSEKYSAALRFVLMVGVMSLFADLTYEGSRSIVGPYLGALGAGALAISVITGFGEFLGYGLRLVSGRGADRTGMYWPITIGGYILQMTVVPLLALAGSWQVAALLVVLERVGKATRNPPRDAMLSHAAKQIGYGWAFGLHEGLDQIGALIGPLALALVLSLRHGDYKLAFASLAVPAAVMLSLLGVARVVYPRPQDLEPATAEVTSAGLPRVFWVYLAGAALAGAGFADYPLIGYHLERSSTVGSTLVPVFYAVAMAVSGLGSLAFGRIFDRKGIAVLVPLTIVSAAYAPLAFFGGFWVAFAGVAVWGLGMGVQESIMAAAVAPMVPPNRRSSAYGLFTGAYGTAWFLGSVAIGALYDVSFTALVTFSIVAELAAVPFILVVHLRTRPALPASPAT
ncbi:MAG: MFS transporter [Acidimicrobiales bacterium]